MTIGLKTTNHFVDEKKGAIEDAVKKLGLDANIIVEVFDPPSDAQQTFGFEELIKKSKQYANEVFKNKDLNLDLGIGIESTLSFIYSSNEWYYVNCIAVQTKSGNFKTSFTSGISLPDWIVKEMQDKNVKNFHALIVRLVGHPVDPVDFFSNYTLTRKDLLLPSLLLTISQLVTEAKF